MLDLAFVRAQFPAFDGPACGARGPGPALAPGPGDPVSGGWAFFENAGGSYPCRQVVDRLARFYTRRKVQPYAPYPVSQEAGAEMDEARARLAALMGVAPDWVHFGPSTSANTYTLAQACRSWLGRGEAIVVTDQDHEANSGVWRRLAETGTNVREWRLDPATGLLDPARLADLLGDGRVRLVAFPHCSNVVGAINDVAAIAAMARAAGAVTCVDGVSYAPHGLPDIPALAADIYLFSTYKTYGPHQGIMVVRPDLAAALPNQGHHFNAGTVTKRLTPAGPDHAQIAACAGIADYIDALADHHGIAGDARSRNAAVHARMRAQEAAVVAPLLAWAAARNGLRLIGPADPASRAPTVALDLGRPALAVAEALAHHHIMAGGGHFYAVRPLRAMGVDTDRGVLRLSLVHYTTPAEVDRLIAALDAVM